MSRHQPIAPLLVVGGLAMAACATNPVTGNREFVTISEAQEIAIGREADAQIKSEMGVYEDQQLQQYVEEIGLALAASSHRPDLDWQFAIVDSPVVNAFALPGGYIYLTRGMMAYLSDEAELAGVLGHEIGHVTARHSVQAYSRATGAGWGLLAAQIFVPAMRTPYGAPGLGDAAGAGLGMLFLKFGRDDETQADRLGAEYATASGWDPRGVGDMLSTLARIADTTDRRGTPNWLSTHPAPVDRVAGVSHTVEQLLTATDGGTLRVDRTGYLDRIEGLIYGDNPADGIVRGSEFLHPALRFALAFPGGWEVQNSETLVVAKQPGRDNYMILRLVESSQEELQRIAERDMIEAGYQPEQGTPSSINGLDAYLGTYTREVDDLGPLVARVAYIRAGRSVYVLGGFAPVTEFSYRTQGTPSSINGLDAYLGTYTREVDDLGPLVARVAYIRAGRSVYVLGGFAPVTEFSCQRWEELASSPSSATWTRASDRSGSSVVTKRSKSAPTASPSTSCRRVTPGSASHNEVGRRSSWRRTSPS